MKKTNRLRIILWLVFGVCAVNSPAFGQEDERGLYFPKKKYTPSAVPTFEASKKELPVPVLEANKEWIDLYWKTWELAFAHMKAPQDGSHFVSNYLDEAHSPSIFQWDTHFMILFARYGFNVFPAVESHDNFYARQHENGLIWRVISEEDGSDHPWGGGPRDCKSINPPLFSWAEVESFKLSGDTARLASVVEAIEKYAEYIEGNRRCDNTPHHLYWSNGLACGMDNTPRDYDRPKGHYSFDEWGFVDMSCQMVMQYRDLAKMHKWLGNATKAAAFERKAAVISKKINTWMWNEEAGLYFDVDTNGVQTAWKTVASFWPMLAGVSNADQNAKMLEHLKDTSSFWRKIPFPSLAANQKHYKGSGGYWHGGVWAPTNYMVIKGLEQAGYHEFAAEASQRYVEGIYEVFKATGTLWELYAPDSYAAGTIRKGKELCKPDFVGWTGLGPIALMIENIIGLRTNALENKIEWHVFRNDTHGIKNLKMGDASIDLLFDQDSLKVKSDRPFSLVLHFNGASKTYAIKAGKSSIKVLD